MNEHEHEQEIDRRLALQAERASLPTTREGCRAEIEQIDRQSLSNSPLEAELSSRRRSLLAERLEQLELSAAAAKRRAPTPESTEAETLGSLRAVRRRILEGKASESDMEAARAHRDSHPHFFADLFEGLRPLV